MEYLTIKECARRLKKTENRIYYMARGGDIESQSIYGKLVIPIDAVKRAKRKQNRLRNDYITVPLFCKKNQLTRNKFEVLRKSGKVDAVKIGAHVYVKKEDNNVRKDK